ncbi:MAG TPA: hypothetical protein VNA22_09280 [Pyrinomonadaceae bacterium]|nr:hypothetical protein [Pyrinomonadaceae bacterium]
MKTIERTSHRTIATLVSLVLLLGGPVSQVYGHTVRGIENPTLATARITSPNATVTDLPIPIYNTGVSVACFRVRNTSPYDAVITAVGFDLPGDNGDFSLVLPTSSIFHLDNSVVLEPFFDDRVMDFAFLTGPRFNSDGGKHGLRPSASFTDMCASGRYPAGMSIESMLNHVFVRFSKVGPDGNLRDIGIWENAPQP